MTYSIEKHGDILERQAAKLVNQKIPNYELVWQLYIGNKGNNSMAEMPNYPDDYKRKGFAENSYTVLESIYIIEQILKSKIFENELSTFEKYIEFNKSFITVFAFLGRMHDTVIKCSDFLKYDNTSFKKSIHEYYEARNIVIHGKKIPLIFDNLGFLKIPFLKTSITKGAAWDDKISLWDDISSMQEEYVADKLTDFFNELIKLINNEYAVFYDIIVAELKKLNTKIKFEYNDPLIKDSITPSGFEASGSVVISGLDLYGINKARNSKKNR